MSGKTFTVRRGTTAVPNQTIYATYAALADRDGAPQALSIQSLGLLLLLLSRPTGKASMGYRAMMGRGMGQVALLKAMKELGAVGHLYRFKRRSPAGSVITDTVVAEVPLTLAEAEAEWMAQVRQLNGKPVDNSTPDRAAEFNATGAATTATVRRFTDARSNNASPVPGAKGSLKTSSFIEPGENQREEKPPAQSGTTPADAAALPRTSPFGLTPEQQSLNSMGAAMARAALRGTSNEVAPLRHGREAGPGMGAQA